MALTRSELKMLIKECLVEILSEGLGNVQAAASRPLPPGRMPIRGSVREGKRNDKRRFDPALDTPVLKDQIRANSGGNPIMQAILQDTANTTLRTLASDRSLGSAALEEGAGGRSSQGIPQVEQISGSPEEVFGEEAASKWYALAFATPKKLA